MGVSVIKSNVVAVGGWVWETIWPRMSERNQ